MNGAIVPKLEDNPMDGAIVLKHEDNPMDEAIVPRLEDYAINGAIVPKLEDNPMNGAIVLNLEDNPMDEAVVLKLEDNPMDGAIVLQPKVLTLKDLPEPTVSTGYTDGPPAATQHFDSYHGVWSTTEILPFKTSPDSDRPEEKERSTRVFSWSASDCKLVILVAAITVLTAWLVPPLTVIICLPCRRRRTGDKNTREDCLVLFSHFVLACLIWSLAMYFFWVPQVIVGVESSPDATNNTLNN